MGSKEKRSVSFEGRLPREEALTHLRALVRGLEDGSVQIENGGEELTLEPTNPIKIEIKGTDKGRKQALKISLKWERFSRDDQAGPFGFAISSDEPEYEEEDDEDEDEDSDDDEDRD